MRRPPHPIGLSLLATLALAAPSLAQAARDPGLDVLESEIARLAAIAGRANRAWHGMASPRLDGTRPAR